MLSNCDASPREIPGISPRLLHLSRIARRGGLTPTSDLQVDMSVSFDQVGGLEQYVKALKEMVFLPLVYPELFERFHIVPPRGVLFYGPPGAFLSPTSLSGI
jgi:hypothetical protein